MHDPRCPSNDPECDAGKLNVGGVVEPPLRNLEGNPRRGVPTMGETEQEGELVSTNNGKACLSLRTPMAYSASTATT